MTREQYYSKRITTQKKVTFIARCGHERISSYGAMKFSKDWSCNDCTDKRTALVKKINSKISECLNGNVIEYQGFIYLQEILVNRYNIVRSFEGSKSDFIIKPIDVKSDEWLQVQLKTTQKIINDKYQFGMHKSDYTDMLVIAVCIDANLCWSIEGSFVKNLQTLTCSTKCNTKYKPFQSNIDDLLEIIELYYYCGGLPHIKIKNSYVSNNPQGVQEFKYMQKRIMGLDLPFLSNVIEGMNNDFTLNEMKIQEKVMTKCTRSDEKFESTIAKYYGRNENKKIKYGPYEKSDNDFYWFHIPNMDLFYVLPENLLVKWGTIKTDDQPGKTKISFFPIKNENRRKIITKDAELYLFDYSDHSLNRLKEMFNILK